MSDEDEIIRSDSFVIHKQNPVHAYIKEILLLVIAIIDIVKLVIESWGHK